MINGISVVRGLPESTKGVMVRNPTTGEIMTKEHLPPKNTKRWPVSKKMLVVAAVKGELVSLEEVCERYHMSEEEYRLWENQLEKHGPLGLRVTRIHNYRNSE